MNGSNASNSYGSFSSSNVIVRRSELGINSFCLNFKDNLLNGELV